MKKIALIDLGMGNLKSVLKAFERIGLAVHVTADPDVVRKSSVVILPGVGAFGDGMERIRSSGLLEPLRHHALIRKKPLVGICLGMQLLADESEEHGVHQGLGIIRGRVVRLQPDRDGFRVPNIGWCEVKKLRSDGLFASLPDKADFYFVHSYFMHCDDPDDVSAVIGYGSRNIAAALEKGNIFGVQFHPEKSQDNGLEMLHSFAHIIESSRLKTEG